MTLLQNSSIFEGVNLKNTLQQASRSMTETVSGLEKQVINPFKAVTGSIQAGVATISETQSVLMQNISTYKSQAIDGINSTLKGLTGGLFNLGDLGGLVKYEDGFKLDTDGLFRLAGKGLGFNLNSLADLKSQVGDQIMNELNSMTGGLGKGLFMLDESGNFIKVKIADDWKYSVGSNLIDFLGKDDQDRFGSIVNVAAMNSVLNVMLAQSIQSSLTQGYQNFGNMYTFQSDYHDALIDNIGIAIGRGDLDSINTILDIIQKEGTNKVAAKYPDLIQTMLANFSFTDDTDPSDYPSLAEALFKVCIAIGGSGWWQLSTQFGLATNVSLVNTVSADAKTLLMTSDTLVPLLCASGVFTEQSALDQFASDFPTALSYSPA